MDVSYWGPSGWQLLHLIAAKGGTEAKELLGIMPFILPCKYCRASAQEFLKEEKPHGDLQRWLYTFHNKVNHKLEKQHQEDPKCNLPVPAPPFEEVQKKYNELLNSKPTEIPGRDFLYSIAHNYGNAHMDAQTYEELHLSFWDDLKHSFPFEEFRKHIDYPDLTNNLTYLRSVHAMFSKMKPQKPLKYIRQQLEYYKSGCSSKTYKGKTCKKVGDRYTKIRDRKRTYRLTHSRLL
jgi:hypothetical protein